MVKPPLRTKTLGTKVSEEEFAQLEAAASERGLTLSEWCRETLLASVNGQEEKSADAGGTGRVAHPYGGCYETRWRNPGFPNISIRCVRDGDNRIKAYCRYGTLLQSNPLLAGMGRHVYGL